MGIDIKIRDEKLQYDINREAEISALWSGKIHKYEYLADEEILLSGQSRIIEQAKRTCIIKYKTLNINVIPYTHNILAVMWWMRITENFEQTNRCWNYITKYFHKTYWNIFVIYITNILMHYYLINICKYKRCTKTTLQATTCLRPVTQMESYMPNLIKNLGII